MSLMSIKEIRRMISKLIVESFDESQYQGLELPEALSGKYAIGAAGNNPWEPVRAISELYSGDSGGESGYNYSGDYWSFVNDEDVIFARSATSYEKDTSMRHQFVYDYQNVYKIKPMFCVTLAPEAQVTGTAVDTLFIMWELSQNQNFPKEIVFMDTWPTRNGSNSLLTRPEDIRRYLDDSVKSSSLNLQQIIDEILQSGSSNSLIQLSSKDFVKVAKACEGTGRESAVVEAFNALPYHTQEAVAFTTHMPLYLIDAVMASDDSRIWPHGFNNKSIIYNDTPATRGLLHKYLSHRNPTKSGFAASSLRQMDHIQEIGLNPIDNSKPPKH